MTPNKPMINVTTSSTAFAPTTSKATNMSMATMVKASETVKSTEPETDPKTENKSDLVKEVVEEE